MDNNEKKVSSLAFLGFSAIATNIAFAQCEDVPTYYDLKAAMDASGATSTAANGGFGLNMWGTIVNRDGYVCAVAFTGKNRGDQWPGSRVISAAKAFTGNAYSLPGLALSTANLYASNQAGGSLWGLQFSNPVNAALTGGNPVFFGTVNDPMVDQKVAGQIVFGGGFAMYNGEGKIVGGLGVSGDTSCKDHNFGWRVRHALNMDFVPAGVNPDTTRPDNIIYDMGPASSVKIASPSAWGHVDCGVNNESGISETLPPTQ